MASSTVVALEPTSVTFYPPSCGPLTKFWLRNLTQNEVTFQLFLGPHMATRDKSGMLEGGQAKETVITYDRPDKEFCDDVAKNSKALRAFIAIKAVHGGKSQMAKLLCNYSTDRPAAQEEPKPVAKTGTLKKLKVSYEGKDETNDEINKMSKGNSVHEGGAEKKTANVEVKEGKKAKGKQDNEKKRKEGNVGEVNEKEGKDSKAKEGKEQKRKGTVKEVVLEPTRREEIVIEPENVGKIPTGPIRPQFRRPVPMEPSVAEENVRGKGGKITDQKNEKSKQAKESEMGRPSEVITTTVLSSSPLDKPASESAKPEPARKPADPRTRHKQPPGKQPHQSSQPTPTDPAGKVPEHAGVQSKPTIPISSGNPHMTGPPTTTNASTAPPLSTPTPADDTPLPPPSVSSSRANSLTTASRDSLSYISGQQFPSPCRAPSPETNRILESISFSPLTQSPVFGCSVRRKDSIVSAPEQTTTFATSTAIVPPAESLQRVPSQSQLQTQHQEPPVQSTASAGEGTVAIIPQPPKQKIMDPRLRRQAELERKRWESTMSATSAAGIEQPQPISSEITPVVTKDGSKQVPKTGGVGVAGDDVGLATRVSTGVGDSVVGVGDAKEREGKDEEERGKEDGVQRKGEGETVGKRKDGWVEYEGKDGKESKERDEASERERLLRKQGEVSEGVETKKGETLNMQEKWSGKEKKGRKEEEFAGGNEMRETQKETKRRSVKAEGESGVEVRKRNSELESEFEIEQEGGLKSRKRKRVDGSENLDFRDDEKEGDIPHPTKTSKVRKVDKKESRAEKENKGSVSGKDRALQKKEKEKLSPEMENTIDSSEEKEDEAAFLWAQEEMEEERREREREKMRENEGGGMGRKEWLERGRSDQEVNEVYQNEKGKGGTEEERERRRRERKEQWERERKERQEREVERKEREKREREEQRQRDRKEREEREREWKERTERERQKEKEEREKREREREGEREREREGERERERESSTRTRKDSSNVERRSMDREREGGSGERRNDRDRYGEMATSRRPAREAGRDTPSHGVGRQTPTPKTGRDTYTTTTTPRENERIGGGSERERGGTFKAPAPRSEMYGRNDDTRDRARVDISPVSRTNQTSEVEEKSDLLESIAWLFEEDGRYDPVFGYKRPPPPTPTTTPQGSGTKKSRARADTEPAHDPPIRYIQGGNDDTATASVVEDIPAWFEPSDETGFSSWETEDLAVVRVGSTESDSGYACPDCMYTCMGAEQLDRHTMQAHHTHLYVLADCCMHISGLVQVPDPARNVHVAGFCYNQGDGPRALEWFGYWAEAFPAGAAIAAPCYSQYSAVMRAALMAGRVSTHQNARVALMMGGPNDESLQAQLAGVHVKVHAYSDSMALDGVVKSFTCERVAGNQPLSPVVLGTVPPGVQYVLFADVCSCPTILDDVALIPPNTMVHVFAPQGPFAYTLPPTLHSRSQVHIHTDINNNTDAALCFWVGRIDSLAPKDCVFAVVSSVSALGGLHLWVDSARPLDVILLKPGDDLSLSSVLDTCWGATAGGSLEEREEEGEVERGTGPVWDSGVDLETYLKECLDEMSGSGESGNESGDDGEEEESGSDDEGSHGEADMEVTSISSGGSESGGEDLGERDGENKGERERKRRGSVVERDGVKSRSRDR